MDVRRKRCVIVYNNKVKLLRQNKNITIVNIVELAPQLLLSSIR